ncbi:MAG: bifunctional UDP-sugar hydrolase/5'-nucleotidase [Planctomycetota bacterium]
MPIRARLLPGLRPLCTAALGVLFAVAARAQDAAAPAPHPTDVVWLHMNDFHGQFRPQLAFWKARAAGDRRELPQVGGAAALAGYVQRARVEAAAKGQRLVLSDAGDWYQGTIEGNETKGRLSIAFLARLGVEVAALGNHEYDFGPENVQALCKLAPFPVLAANVVRAGAPERQPVDYVRPFAVVDVGGVRVAVIGLVTEQTKTVSTGPWGDAEFEAEAAALQATLPAAKAASDVTVLLTHCGVEVDRELAKQFPEIGLILGGHSHTGLKEPMRVGRTWIVQTHGKASEIYRLEGRADAAAKTLEWTGGGLVELDLEQHPADGATADWIAEQTADISARWDRVIGTLETSLDDDRGARSTAAGNLVCDAFREFAKADLAFTNKGGLRTRLMAGPLTPRMLYELLPFENDVMCVELTGAQLRGILTAAIANGRRPLEIGGGTYTYAVAGKERVLRAVTVGGEPLDDVKTYRVATSSFLARGGDGLDGFAAGKATDLGVLLRDVLIQKAERDKKLSASAENRILFERDKDD